MSKIYVVISRNPYYDEFTMFEFASCSKDKADEKLNELKDRLPIIVQAQKELREFQQAYYRDNKEPGYPSFWSTFSDKARLKWLDKRNEWTDELNKRWVAKRDELAVRYGLPSDFTDLDGDTTYEIEELEDE